MPSDGIDFFIGPPEGELEPTWKAAVAGKSAQRYKLPKTPSDQRWGHYSVRRVGRNLNEPTKKANAFRIQAHNTDVVLYLFEEGFFDGRFQAIRVSKGGLRWARFGGMGSFILQRDSFINVSGGQPNQLIAALLQNSLLPTTILADRITAFIHDQVRTQRSRFYRNRLDLKRGRLQWDTLEGVSRSIDSKSWTLDRKRWPYRDYLKYSYKSRGRLKADGANYDIVIELWLEPMLNSGALEFVQRFWRVDVSKHIWHNKIRGAIADQIKQNFEGIGQLLTTGLNGALLNFLGSGATNLMLRGNKQLIFSHPCVYDVQRVDKPEHTYTTAQINNICGWTTPSYAVAPGIRLLK